MSLTLLERGEGVAHAGVKPWKYFCSGTTLENMQDALKRQIKTSMLCNSSCAKTN